MKKDIKQNLQRLVKVCGIVLAVYCTLAMLFYFICGAQLHIRQSRGNIEMQATDGFLQELSGDVTVVQTFRPQIDMLESFSVMWGDYSRQNSGTLKIEVSKVGGAVLASEEFNVSEIKNNTLTTIKLNKTLDNCRDELYQIKITSDSSLGQGVCAAMNSKVLNDDSKLYVNGVLQNGMLCFSATGLDHVWTGAHYLELATIGAVIVFLIASVIVIKVNHGKKSVVYNTWRSLKRYKFLTQQLVARDFKTKYKRSVLGVVWSFLNPLLTSFVMYIVFSQLFRYEIEYYPVYLIIGVVLFNFFSECTTMCLTSIVDNSNLITKVYVPKYIYPFSRTLSSGINLLFALIPPIIIALISGLFPTLAWLLLPVPLLCLMLFSFGVGLLLASLMVFFRDMRFLWGVIIMMWMYLTPLFYPAEVLSENFAWILKCNPLYYFVDFARTLIIDGISPEPISYVMCALSAVIIFIIGLFVFKKAEDKFIHYL